MKKYFVFLMAFFLCACTATAYSKSKDIGAESNFPKGLLKQIKHRVNDGGFLELELVLKSSSTKDVFYKIDWLDKDGFVLRDPINEGYQLLRIVANQEVVLKKLAFDKRAVEFRVDMKTK